MLKDKMGQEIEVGLWVIKPWNGSFDLGKVIKVTEHTFTYEGNYTDYQGRHRTRNSICKVPERCLVVPDIVANFWSILQ